MLPPRDVANLDWLGENQLAYFFSETEDRWIGGQRYYESDGRSNRLFALRIMVKLSQIS
jgi:hypothetical protein